MFVAFPPPPSFAVANCTGKKMGAEKIFFCIGKYQLEVMKMVGSWGGGVGLYELVTPTIDCRSRTAHQNASTCILLALSTYYRG